MENMDGGSTSSFEFVEVSSLKAARFMRDRGYQTASTTGIESQDVGHTDGFGILKPLETLPNQPRLRRLLFRPRHRREWLGTVWLQNSPRTANAGHWVFEIYGRENVETLQPVLEQMSLEFGIEVEGRLVSEDVKSETLLQDYDF